MIGGGATAAAEAAGLAATGVGVLAEAAPAKSPAATPTAPTPDANFTDHLLVNDMVTTPRKRNMTVRKIPEQQDQKGENTCGDTTGGGK
jgi:hypothetical protein